MQALADTLDFSQGDGAAPLWRLATHVFMVFSLVAARLAGMLSVGPVFGHPAVPRTVRLLLALGLALVVTPSLLTADLNAAGQGRFAHSGCQSIANSPNSLLEFAGLAAVELALGAALGLGVALLLSAMLLAGALVDQQLGLSLADEMNPELKISTAIGGRLLYLLGVAAFVCAGGHVLLTTALMDSFAAIPVGFGSLPPPLAETLNSLVQQSLLLALRVAAPLLAAAMLTSFALGVLGRTLPQLQSLAVGIPV
ncbi:MAG: flagellar biosynthetic protein FliR, partial [Planctomycetaceae bacterium]